MNKLTTTNPFALMRHMAPELERLFDEFGTVFGRKPFFWTEPELAPIAWAPDLEMIEREKELVVRVDLPGMTKSDVKLEVTDQFLTIEGERKKEREEKREGFYRSERAYGKFARSIPLPEGVKADQVKATFKDGVLEVVMPTTSTVAKKPRRVEIVESPAEKAKTAA